MSATPSGHALEHASYQKHIRSGVRREPERLMATVFHGNDKGIEVLRKCFTKFSRLPQGKTIHMCVNRLALEVLTIFIFCLNLDQTC